MNYVPVMLIFAALANHSEPTDYRTAFDLAMKGNQPLLVLVTADWCPPCKKMKATTIPHMIDNNQFAGFHFATVDLDRDYKDARNLIGNGTVPQLIVYEKNNGKWKQRSLGGYHSPEVVDAFLSRSRPVLTAKARSTTGK